MGNNSLTIGFIGAGTVGTALAALLSRSGYDVAAVYSRSRASAEKLAARVGSCRVMDSGQAVADAAALTFITTPDGAIAAVVSSVQWPPGHDVVHCSGSDSVAVLEPARRAGAGVGGFHPLQTFAGVQQAIDNIPGSTFALEADEPLLSTLKEMAGAIGGRWITLQAGDKVAYHAAAVLACNYLVTLVKMSTDLWETFGIPSDEAIQALLPLIRGTLHNIESVGIPDCLTGPIARGDTGTITKHLDVIKEKIPSLLPAYRALGLQTVPVALARGKIGREAAREMETILRN